jgi:hypothetical protein
VREKSLKTALDLMQQIRFIINELPGRQVDETTFGQMCALAIYQYADWLGMNGAMPMDQLTALALMKSQGKPQ